MESVGEGDDRRLALTREREEDGHLIGCPWRPTRISLISLVSCAKVSEVAVGQFAVAISAQASCSLHFSMPGRVASKRLLDLSVHLESSPGSHTSKNDW